MRRPHVVHFSRGPFSIDLTKALSSRRKKRTVPVSSVLLHASCLSVRHQRVLLVHRHGCSHHKKLEDVALHVVGELVPHVLHVPLSQELACVAKPAVTRSEFGFVRETILHIIIEQFDRCSESCTFQGQ